MWQFATHPMCLESLTKWEKVGIVSLTLQNLIEICLLSEVAKLVSSQ